MIGLESAGIALLRCTERVVGMPSQTPAELRQDLVRPKPLRQHRAEAEVAAQYARRGQHQVADAAQPREGLRPRAGVDPDARHFRQTAR